MILKISPISIMAFRLNLNANAQGSARQEKGEGICPELREVSSVRYWV